MQTDAAKRREPAIRELLTEISRRVYSGPIPGTEGGMVFREVASHLGCREDEVSSVARKMGVWEFTLKEIGASASERPGYVPTYEEFLIEQFGE